jgi:hypothetical protein
MHVEVSRIDELAKFAIEQAGTLFSIECDV